MAQTTYIPITDDSSATNYYELFLDGVTQYVQYSPLPQFLAGSPAVLTPCIMLEPLPDSTTYSYQVRRFNFDNTPSKWTTGNFTT